MLRTYDALGAIAGMKKQVYENDDICEVISDVDMALAQEVKIGNSIEKVVKDGIEKLIEKIPNEKEMQKILKQLPKALEKVNPETLEVLKKVGKWGFAGSGRSPLPVAPFCERGKKWMELLLGRD